MPMIKLRIDVYSHFFKVSRIHPTLYIMMRKAFDELTHVQYVKVKGRYQKQTDKVFACRVKPLGEYRFHINYLLRFRELLTQAGIYVQEIEEVNHPLYTPIPINVSLPDGVSLYDYQEEVKSFILKDGVSKLVTLQTGRGKMNPNTSLVRVPNGWKKMGDLQVGDMLSMPNGDAAPVTQIFEHTDKPMFRVTFADGRTSDCGGEHLWEVINEDEGVYKTLSTFELLDNSDKVYSIPLIDPTHSADKETEIPDEVQKRWSHGQINLKDLKHYMKGSFEQRLFALQKILDTSGAIEGSDIYYNTFKKEIADDVVYYARSLGCIASYDKTSYGYKVIIKASIPSMLFSDLGKKEACNDLHPDLVNGLKLQIKSIEPIPSVPSRCITVDHPDHLYIVDDFVVTHNTLTSLATAEAYGKRILVYVLGRYKEKWVQDVKEAYGDDVNLLVVKSKEHLIQLGMLCKEDPVYRNNLADVIICTIGLIRGYIDEWEKHAGQEIDGMVPPEDLYEALGIGYRIIDEAHQHFHGVYTIDLYTHCPKCVYLTATLDTNERFMDFIYSLMWPKHQRPEQLAPICYDETYALMYNHASPDRLRYTNKQGYSHVMFEQAIWRYAPARYQYLDMIGDIIEQYFLPIYKPGRKMLLFFSLIVVCEEVVIYLNHRFKDRGLKISRYVTGDSKEIIDTSDITVSTLGKSGTALDIPGLVRVLMTVALAEPKANKQAKGRNRDLSKKPGFEDVTPMFLYLNCEDIPKHRQYHKEKLSLFKGLTKVHETRYVGYTIGMKMGDYRQSGKRQYFDAYEAVDQHYQTHQKQLEEQRKQSREESSSRPTPVQKTYQPYQPHHYNGYRSTGHYKGVRHNHYSYYRR